MNKFQCQLEEEENCLKKNKKKPRKPKKLKHPRKLPHQKKLKNLKSLLERLAKT
jgi:hypothetical protein